jgi:hypothetical protein
MELIAKFIVVALCVLLLILAGAVFAKRALAERFFMSFASSARTHYIEQAFRLLIGSALVVLSPSMWQPNLFRFIGWAIVIPTIVLILTPWQWHHRFGARVLPLFIRYIRIYALGMVAFAVLLMFGVFFVDTHGDG